jgi:hypothetical protein
MIMKFLFFIGWIGLALMSLAGLLTSIIPSYGSVIDFQSYGFRGGLFVVSLFYFLLFVEKIAEIFVKDDSGYEFKTDQGLIKVSAASVNNLIKEITESNKNVKNVKITSQQGKKGIKIKIRMDIYTLPNLTSEYKKIQDLIAEELLEKLSIEVEKIDIITNKLLNNGRSVTIKKDDEVKVEGVKIEDADPDSRGADNE